MRRSSACWATLCLLAVSVLGACAPASSGAAGEHTQSDLEAVLQSPSTLSTREPVEVEFTLINHTETGLYVLTWYMPLEGIAGEIFRVERDGQPIPYEGLLASRGVPTPEDYVFLEPGGSASATVDLATVYDFSEPGQYTIAFISPRISHVATAEDEMAASMDDLGPVEIASDSIVVEIQDSAGE
ncbi:MAG: hypothetical protein PVI59_04900 [Anaerolineae bacterium]